MPRSSAPTLTPDVRRQLHALAAETGRSEADLIAEAEARMKADASRPDAARAALLAVRGPIPGMRTT